MQKNANKKSQGAMTSATPVIYLQSQIKGKGKDGKVHPKRGQEGPDGE